MKSKVHVQLHDSSNIRRTILESAKTLTTNLQKQRHLKEIKTLKTKKVRALKRLLVDIKEALKQVDMKEIPGFKTKPLPKVQPKLKQPKSIKKEQPKEVDQLQLDLDDIERKLRSL